MEYLKHDLSYGDPTKWIDLHFISDSHLGAVGHNSKALTERIKSIEQNPRAVWFGVGDLGDYIFYSDPRFTMSMIRNADDFKEFKQGIGKQVRQIAYKFEPIAKKCIGLGTGNHEEKIVQRYDGYDPTWDLCERLKVKYMGYSALTILKINTIHEKSNTVNYVKVFTHHGFGGGRRVGSKLNKVEDAMKVADADIYAMAHVHAKTGNKIIVKGINSAGKPIEQEKVFIITGSFQDNSVKGATTYAERMMFTKTPDGSPTVRIRWTGNKHRLETQVVL